MARFDLTDFEWSVIQPLLPTKVRGGVAARRYTGGRRCLHRREWQVLNGIFWRLRDLRTLGRYSGARQSLHDLREPFQPAARQWFAKGKA